MGFIQKKNKKGKPAVIRYACFSRKNHTEQFYGMLLKLYLPHRSDDQVKGNSNATFYATAFVTIPGTNVLKLVYEIVESNRSRYDNTSEVKRAVQDFAGAGLVEDAWASFAPFTELVHIESVLERQPLDVEVVQEQEDVPEYSRNMEERTMTCLNCVTHIFHRNCSIQYC